MNKGRSEVLRQSIASQLSELNLAELTMVADYIRGLKAADKFLNRT